MKLLFSLGFVFLFALLLDAMSPFPFFYFFAVLLLFLSVSILPFTVFAVNIMIGYLFAFAYTMIRLGFVGGFHSLSYEIIIHTAGYLLLFSILLYASLQKQSFEGRAR